MTTIPDDQLLSNAETLKGKVVLITGAANGIGQVRCRNFVPQEVDLRVHGFGL